MSVFRLPSVERSGRLILFLISDFGLRGTSSQERLPRHRWPATRFAWLRIFFLGCGHGPLWWLGILIFFIIIFFTDDVDGAAFAFIVDAAQVFPNNAQADELHSAQEENDSDE